MLVRQVLQAHQVQLGILTRLHHHGLHHRQLAVLRQLRQVRLTQTAFIGMVVETRQSPSKLRNDAVFDYRFPNSNKLFRRM